MLNENDVIVFDREYIYAASNIKKYTDALETMLDSYTRCIETILEQAIQDELITEKLNALIAEIKPVGKVIERVGEDAASECISYVGQIDDADKFLY